MRLKPKANNDNNYFKLTLDKPVTTIYEFSVKINY